MNVYQKGFVLASLLSVTLALQTGCKSRFVEATIKNNGHGSLHVLEFDYPSATFGKDLLAAGASYQYRFKLQGSGPAKLVFTDDQGKIHTAPGPQLSEGEQGSLSVAVDATGNASWSTNLQPPE